MALTRNGSHQLSGLSRFHGAVGAYGLRSALDNNGKRNNFNSGEHAVSDVTNRAAIPSGYRHPIAWRMGTKAGTVVSRNDIGITLAASGSGAMGKNTSGTAGIVFGLTGTGGLISSASGSAALALAASGVLFASKAVAGSATVTLTTNGVTIALGHTGGIAGVSLDCDWSPYAIGWLSGTTAEAGLTPNGIANAVWQKVVEAGFSAEEILRLIAAYAAGSATGLEGANPQFTGIDGTTLRIDGAYNAGTRTIDSLYGGETLVVPPEQPYFVSGYVADGYVENQE